MFKKLTFYPRRGGLCEVYEIFNAGNSFDTKDIKKVISKVGKSIDEPTDFLIPNELSFNRYKEDILDLFDAK